MPAGAQLAEEFNPPRANCCLVNNARALADQLQDWNQLSRYHQANQQLKKQGVPANRVVFMGDSITDFWNLEESFPGKPYVNRGIGGQTTPQMLVRFRSDVIALRPRMVHILAGTNDLAGNTGPNRPQDFKDNIASMVALARERGIRVILGSIPPAKIFTGKP